MKLSTMLHKKDPEKYLVWEYHKPGVQNNLQVQSISHSNGRQWIIAWRTGKRMWDPTTSESGMISSQSYPGICQSYGTRLVVNMIIIIMHAKQMMNESLKRCQIRGTVKHIIRCQTRLEKGTSYEPSIQNVEHSTSLKVDPHVLQCPMSNGPNEKRKGWRTCYKRTCVPTVPSRDGYSVHQRRTSYKEDLCQEH